MTQAAQKEFKRSLVWFRRDLRSFDHAALYQALTRSEKVFSVFVFDTDILDALPSRQDRRVDFILRSVLELKADLLDRGSDLCIVHGPARQLVPELAEEMGVQAVFTNHDYEPKAIARDRQVEQSLGRSSIVLLTFKDQVIFEKNEILTGSSTPFKVFTAYKNAWLAKLESSNLAPYPVERVEKALARTSEFPRRRSIHELKDIGFDVPSAADLCVPPGMSGGRRLLRDFLKRMDVYDRLRDYPALKGPSYLSTHLRFGTVSIRELAREAEKRVRSKGASTWLGELIWRDFYFMILYQHPHVEKHAFRPEYEDIPFTNDRAKFNAWKKGMTGYPIVDAAMRQLNTTGYMHNRLRMIAASFLVKDLHVDWRWGESYFKDTLLDFDLAANNGGWQWSASTGCDAQPYFRIFNPVSQSKRFDPEGRFIRLYVPELSGFDARSIHAPWLASAGEQSKAGCVIGKDYPAPVVDHAAARKETLRLFHLDKAPERT